MYVKARLLIINICSNYRARIINWRFLGLNSWPYCVAFSKNMAKSGPSSDLTRALGGTCKCAWALGTERHFTKILSFILPSSNERKINKSTTCNPADCEISLMGVEQCEKVFNCQERLSELENKTVSFPECL